jgi:hypothetical protein
MATGKLFDVEFQIVKARSGSFEGRKDSYRREVRKAMVFAASSSACAAVLTAAITLAGGETIETIHIANRDIGGEGVAYS